jgi:hypothetical protein
MSKEKHDLNSNDVFEDGFVHAIEVFLGLAYITLTFISNKLSNHFMLYLIQTIEHFIGCVQVVSMEPTNLLEKGGVLCVCSPLQSPKTKNCSQGQLTTN